MIKNDIFISREVFISVAHSALCIVCARILSIALLKVDNTGSKPCETGIFFIIVEMSSLDILCLLNDRFISRDKPNISLELPLKYMIIAKIFFNRSLK